MKKILFLLTTMSSLTAFAQQPIGCAFTEPFFDINVDVNNSKVILREIDWDSANGKKIDTDLSRDLNIVSKLENGLPTININNKKSGENVLKLTLDYKGSDGMSDSDYAYSVKYTRGDRTLYGGCDTDSIQAVNTPDLDKNEALFFADAKKAIVQCYSRAFSAWTSEASDYEKKVSKFTILYRSDVVPGEPGNVSQTFSSWEGMELTRIAELASAVPHSSNELKSHKELKINYCDTYAQYLQTRYEAKKP